MPVTRWFADLARLPEGVARDVLVTAEDEWITDVETGARPPRDARRLSGLVLPGLANAHSHVFHRALRGRAEVVGPDFWGWREEMYALAARLDPDTYRGLARATFAEMAVAGITAVGEFHYLHHGPGGRPYERPTAMAEALVAAAEDAGVRLTLLDTCYLRGGVDRPLEGVQRRFGDRDADAWAARASALAPAPHLRQGAAIHSVRAVDADAMTVVREWAEERDAPLHAHVSEQPRENEECQAATGRTPTGLLADVGALSRRFTAVHATHLTGADVSLLGGSGSGACLCPTTERSLADGIGPASALAAAGSPLSLGSDSHAVIDLFEEARAVELDERLATGRRGHHTPQGLLAAATSGGMEALGWASGAIEPGRLADLVAIDLSSPRLAGACPADLDAHVVFAATAADVTDVVVSGRAVVAERRHLRVGDVGAALSQAITEARER